MQGEKISKLNKLKAKLVEEQKKLKKAESKVASLKSEIDIEETKELKQFLTKNNLTLEDLKKTIQKQGGTQHENF